MVGLRAWRRNRCLAICFISCCLAFGARAAPAQDGESFISREYPLKALFLYNFGGYIEWPPDTFSSEQAPFVIGVLGSAPIDETLRQIAATKTIGNRKIVVQQYNSVRDIKPCQILFISRSVPPEQQRLAIDSLKDQHVLIVGESPSFAVNGGCVNFFVEANKIRFEINLEATKQQQLKISAKLLAMAQIVPASSRGSVER